MASDTRFCPVCQTNVNTSMRINWIILILLLLIGFVVLGLIYFVYCWVSSSHRKCAICGCKTLLPPKSDKVE